MDNRCPLPLRDRQPDPAFSEFLANLTVPPYSPLWRKSQRVSPQNREPGYLAHEKHHLQQQDAGQPGVVSSIFQGVHKGL